MTNTKNRCACGRGMSKLSRECNACYKHIKAERIKKAQEIVATRKCPQCGQGLTRNLAAPLGWWQCVGYGVEGFRKPGSKECNFQLRLPKVQTFTK